MFQYETIHGPYTFEALIQQFHTQDDVPQQASSSPQEELLALKNDILSKKDWHKYSFFRGKYVSNTPTTIAGKKLLPYNPTG